MAGSATSSIERSSANQENLKDLVINNVMGIPQSLSDWLSGGFSPHGYVFLEFNGHTVWESYRTPNNMGLLKAPL
jgi:hypothetical protein